MKLRHTAALALVGWYLMCPPSPYRKNAVLTAETPPLSRWDILRVFDSAAECDQQLSAWRKTSNQFYDALMRARATAQSNKGNLHPKPMPKVDPALGNLSMDQLWAMSNADCIASDDPRLKESK